jgi:hypothetical protein
VQANGVLGGLQDFANGVEDFFTGRKRPQPLYRYNTFAEADVLTASGVGGSLASGAMGGGASSGGPSSSAGDSSAGSGNASGDCGDLVDDGGERCHGSYSAVYRHGAERFGE